MQHFEKGAVANNKKVIILCTVGVFLIGGTTFGILKYQNSQVKASKVSATVKKVNKNYNDLVSEKNYNKKLKELTNLEKEYKQYLASNNKDSKITTEYQNDIAKGKSYFQEKANSSIKNNTSKKLSDETNDTLTLKIKNLNSTLSKIFNQKGVVYTSREVKSYKTKISKLTDKYSKKANELAEKESSESSSIAASSSSAASSLAASSSAQAASTAASSTSSSTTYAKSTTTSANTGTRTSTTNNTARATTGTTTGSKTSTGTTSSYHSSTTSSKSTGTNTNSGTSNGGQTLNWDNGDKSYDTGNHVENYASDGSDLGGFDIN
ncbi:hypothetical protein LB941_08465 [Ligilactobacillus sp. WILCCON 0076]|uniref:Uncharacterized protein n=1 Tax=Ligilactobacillus ubinensis TaxID=2876789 RepID=A0A9X2FKM9_9LACO|nr:hypothetical protein [Ligilactobacillus ubinensis]MCP0887366.1 hypothetical protein [Ligilactobacillus ubinensis]